MALTLSALAALMKGTGTPEQKAAFAKAVQKRQMQKMSPAQRAAQKQANKTGQPVSYIGGSNKVGVSSGIAQPMTLPKFAATEPAATATTQTTTSPATPAYDPTPLTIGGNTTETTTPTPEPEIKPADLAPAPAMFMPGGAGTAVGGNAAGMRRKKSSGRLAGLTSKGPGQFKITGQSGKSSGLNIGV